MRSPLRGVRDWYRRKPKITRSRETATKYTIRFKVGGEKYYMVWDAWVPLDGGGWELLTPDQMACAVEYWIKDHTYVRLQRSGGDVSVIRTAAIDEYEVIDNNTFRNEN
jgi:hypothetical protein